MESFGIIHHTTDALPKNYIPVREYAGIAPQENVNKLVECVMSYKACVDDTDPKKCEEAYQNIVNCQEIMPHIKPELIGMALECSDHRIDLDLQNGY